MLQQLANIITYQLLQLQEGTKLASTVNYFLYDAIKIILLIFTVIAVINFVQTFFDPNKVKKKIGKLPWGVGNVAASLFGAITPFCSCSSIPLFIGFLEARIPSGIAFSFLITSPLVNEVAFVIMGNYFGWKLAIMYALAGIALGVVGGLLMGALKMDKELILKPVGAIRESRLQGNASKTFFARLKFALRMGRSTLKKLYIYVILGIALGAIIHGYVPQDFFVNTVGKYEILAVPLAVIVGVPIYAGCSTVAPIIFSITAGGVPLGTSLAFMMSIAGLSLPEAVMLKRVMSTKLLATFFGLVAIGIIAIGYLFNFL